MSGITKVHPSTKHTVGSQYICMDTMDANNEWTSSFSSDVTELPTVVDVEFKDNSDAYDSYASGAVYESDAPVTSQEISETNIAFPAMLLAELRGETTDSDGVVLGGGYGVRPYFAYGCEIINKDGSKELRWYPKCKLTENSDKTATSEDSHKEQNDTVTIKAYGFDTDGHTYIKALTGESGMSTLTNAAFFAAPLLTIAAVKALIPPPQNTGGGGGGG